MHIYDMILLFKLFDSFSGKAIQFGYKNWVLTLNDGYPYKIIPYQGKAMGTDHGSFGPGVVNSLLEVALHNMKYSLIIFYVCCFAEKPTWSGYQGCWDYSS